MAIDLMRLPVRLIYTYEPSRSAEGVAWIEVDHKRDVPDGVVIANVLHELDERCRAHHGWGLWSVEPADHRVVHYANERCEDPKTGHRYMLARHRIELR